MKKSAILFAVLVILFAGISYAGLLDDLLKQTDPSYKNKSDDNTTVSGLKEALTIGTRNSVVKVSRVDGYFGDPAIKILMPEKIKKTADVLSKMGFKRQVDNFVLSMNRAAEKAAPEAASIFIDAIREMTFEDAIEILRGGDTAATDFFRAKTNDKLYVAFKPVISSSMDQVGVTRSYKEMMGKCKSLPFVKKESVDLDHYVTTKALDGLFYMIGQEEKKIRKDPAARVTELLRKVFGR